MPAALLTIFLASLAASPAVRWLGPRAALMLAALPAGIALWLGGHQAGIAAGETLSWSQPWVPSLGIELAFRLDGLSALFALLVTGIGSLILVYAGGYLKDDARLGRFLAFLLVFMGAMLGLVTADDLFVLFVFWELTTFSSFLLIGFETGREPARAAARQSLLVTGAGGLALLAGVLLLVDAAGTSSLSQLAGRGELVRAHPHYEAILVLVAIGAFSKSAQFPFHFWLPGAMQAPTPVSAYLHSSTMVKAGVFLLARLSPTLGGTDAWAALLGAAGTATMLIGAVVALGAADLKRLLAGTTLAILGLLTLLLGLGTPIAARAFAVTVLAHAFYKGTLFLVAGNVDHGAGTRDVRRLGGLRKAMPWTAAAAGVAAVSMAGAPPLFGFLAKETAYEAVLEAPRLAPWLGAATVATAIVLVASALRVGFEAFAGTARDLPRAPHEVPVAMRAGPVVLATFGLSTGALVGPAERLIVAPAASAILQDLAPTGLALWHGFTPILALSLATLALGASLFRVREPIAALCERVAARRRWTAADGFDAAVGGVVRFGGWQRRALQNGSLHRYLNVTLATGIVVAAWGAAGVGLPALQAALPTPIDAAVLALTMVGAVAVALTRQAFTGIAALGAVGLGVALLFLVYSAPDLAITQLVVEVLTVMLLVLVLRRLPRARVRAAPPADRTARIAIACVGGVTMAALAWIAVQPAATPPISDFHLARSVAEAYGRNVVNVILVDFRALDTLGEIAVLATAALGILALLRARRGEAPT